MTTKEIAQTLLRKREGMSPFIMSGQLRDSLGSDGYAEALRRRWIVADEDMSGMVRVTNEMTRVNEIREIAESGPPRSRPFQRISEATPEQKERVFQQSLPKMKEQYASEQASRGVPPDQIEAGWAQMQETIHQFFLTDPDMDAEIEALEGPAGGPGPQGNGQGAEMGAGAVPPEAGPPEGELGPEEPPVEPEPERPEPGGLPMESAMHRYAVGHARRDRLHEAFGTGQPLAYTSPSFGKTTSPTPPGQADGETVDALVKALADEQDPARKEIIKKRIDANRTAA